MYADYTFYSEVFYGTAIDEADFPRLASKASDFLDYYTRGKAALVEDESVLDLLKKACCAVAEQMQEDEADDAVADKARSAALDGGELKSESVGSYSVSYATSADYAKSRSSVMDKRAAYSWIAMQYLVNTGLLYRGGDC